MGAVTQLVLITQDGPFPAFGSDHRPVVVVKLNVFPKPDASPSAVLIDQHYSCSF